MRDLRRVLENRVGPSAKTLGRVAERFDRTDADGLVRNTLHTPKAVGMRWSDCAIADIENRNRAVKEVAA